MKRTRVFQTYPSMKGRMQLVDGSWYLAEGAVVTGDVRMGKDVNVWFGSVVRGDDACIAIGEGTNIQDGTIVHADVEEPNTIGRFVTIGHRAILHGSRVGDHCLIGMGAILMGGCQIGELCLIAAGALVLENAVIPPRSLVVGVPGKVRRPITDAEEEDLRWRASHYIQRARSYL
jgi:carbonic anhydrase/acetyltransferase-like protein (isoleucine patch superfamily)